MDDVLAPDDKREQLFQAGERRGFPALTLERSQWGTPCATTPGGRASWVKLCSAGLSIALAQKIARALRERERDG